MDRIDLHVEVTPVSYNELSENTHVSEKSAVIMERVIHARKIQNQRFKSIEGLFSNAQMSGQLIRKVCILDKTSQDLLSKAMEKLQLSARAYDRILKVSRTIADLAGEDHILHTHVAEAIQLRSLDKQGWAGQ